MIICILFYLSYYVDVYPALVWRNDLLVHSITAELHGCTLCLRVHTELPSSAHICIHTTQDPEREKHIRISPHAAEKTLPPQQPQQHKFAHEQVHLHTQLILCLLSLHILCTPQEASPHTRGQEKSTQSSERVRCIQPHMCSQIHSKPTHTHTHTHSVPPMHVISSA